MGTVWIQRDALSQLQPDGAVPASTSRVRWQVNQISWRAKGGRLTWGGTKAGLSNSCITSRDTVKDGVLEELVHDTMSPVPQHTVHDLPPFTNVSLRLLLSNPEGWKESEELLVLTDEDGTTATASSESK